MHAWHRFYATVTILSTVVLSDYDPAWAAVSVPVTSAVAYEVETTNPFANILNTEAPKAATKDLHVTVIAQDHRFLPNILEVKTGSKVTITFTNQGSHQHNFAFRTLPLQTKTINPGETATVTLTAPAPGSYAYYCSASDHGKNGMTGMLVVTK